jgi:cytoskeletal protein RodZ
MSIQRQYSLPNCTLVLEGWGDMVVANQTEARPLMSKLTNAEFHLVGQEKPLSGGREFFESLTAAVSLYAQELLSGIRTFKSPQTASQLVRLQRLDDNHHRLSVLPPDADPGSGIATHLTRQVDLTTVQLFDLVEAVDQFFADTQTLPDLTFQVAPLAKRDVRRSEPVAKQAIPAAIGASGLALAAIAFFFIPTPQVRQPDDLVPNANKTSSTTGSPAPAAPPPAPTASGSPSPTTSPSTATAPSPTTAAQPDLTTLEAALMTAPEITDPAQVQTLQQQLSTQLDQAWTNRPSVTQDLEYRVGVAKDGAIVGYKPINPAAENSTQQTPLLNLLYIPAAGSQPSSEPIAQYKVVFTAKGVLDISPWQNATASPITGITEITDFEQIKALQPKLYDQIDQNWKDKPSFEKDLVFRVRVKQDGTIVDYKPDSELAAESAKEIPLPKLGKLAEDSDAGAGQDPLALFKVVFKPDGKLEVSPWRGQRN